MSSDNNGKAEQSEDLSAAPDCLPDSLVLYKTVVAQDYEAVMSYDPVKISLYDFVTARGAIVARGFREDDGKWHDEGLTSFLAAPENRQDDVEALHTFSDFSIRSVEQIVPSELFASAAGSKSWYSARPLPSDDPISFAIRAKAVNFDADVKLWKMVGNVNAFDRMRQTQQRELSENAGPSFLVEKLIPRGAITLLVGSRKNGKSTLLLELAATVGNGGGTFCGLNVPAVACEGAAVFICGEDSKRTLYARLERMDPDRKVERLYPIISGAAALTEILAEIDAIRSVSLVVVDPARKFILGDEDGSAGVDSFFSSLEALAEQKHCAVVVAHHPKKAGAFSSLAEVLLAARGSSVFLDRPRVLIAVMRRGDKTIMGIPSVNGTPQHNQMPGVMFENEVTLRRDPDTMRHEPLESTRLADETTTSGLQSVAHLPTDEDRVIIAVRRLNGEGARVMPTGKNGLHERRLPELNGMSRRRIAAAVTSAVSSGRLIDGADGLSAR
jgi:hypothetical protein